MEIVAKLFCKLDSKTEQDRSVFATKKSIGRDEFFNAGKTGLKPKFMLEVLASEYNEETIVAVNGKRYAIYRTYYREFDEIIELYCEEKSGVHG